MKRFFVHFWKLFHLSWYSGHFLLKRNYLITLHMKYLFHNTVFFFLFEVLSLCVKCEGQSTNILLLFLASKHEPEGRVILAEFESFRLLNTYVPNNGWKDEETSFQRRRKWDKRMLEFVVQSSDKPLIWCGDLNVR